MDRRDAVVPWSRARRRLSPALRVPGWLAVTLGGAVAAGPLVALATRAESRGQRFVRATFFSAAFGYLVTSLVDFAEHFRLERRLTGRWLATAAVPAAETLNHAATLATVIGALALTRPPASPAAARDRFVLAAPALFLALGWNDELRYHRRRATHREDMMHTVAHLAAGIMWTALYAMRLLPARAASPTTSACSRSSPAGAAASSSSGRSPRG